MSSRPQARPPGGVGVQDAERWLLDRELFGMRFGLERMRRLLTALDLPPRPRVVHVVGTNGKSSTVRMTEALLRAHGVRTGAYLSPHLVSFAERIRIDGAALDGDTFAAHVARVRRAAELVDRSTGEEDRVTQFEALTAAAIVAFAASGTEAAVVEAGLGGRWDATNVLDGEVVVLTNVGLEHTRWLGPTVAHIAREKLAVVKRAQPPVTLVLGPGLHPEAVAEALAVAGAQGARLVRAGAEPPLAGLTLAARGDFQRRNFAVACVAAKAFLGALEERAVRSAAAGTRVPGRFEIVARDPVTVLDGAHNPHGVAALVQSLEGFLDGRPLVAVLSVLDDKDASSMLAGLLPLCTELVCTSNANPRALSPATLAFLADQATGIQAHLHPDPRAALASARDLARRTDPEGVVLATGSIYLIADLKRPRGTRRASTL